MAAITPHEAHAYLARWKLVNAFETAEMRTASIESRLRRLGSLTASLSLFAVDPRREEGVREVRERWARVRQRPRD